MFDISKSLVAGAYEEWSDEFISKSDGNIYVLPNSLCQEYKKRMRNGFWIEAESLLVPIRFRSLVWLKPTRYLDQLVVDSTYSKKTGLIIKSKINPDTDPDEYII